MEDIEVREVNVKEFKLYLGDNRVYEIYNLTDINTFKKTFCDIAYIKYGYKVSTSQLFMLFSTR